MTVVAPPARPGPSVLGIRPATRCSRVIISLCTLASSAALALKLKGPGGKPPGHGRTKSHQFAQDSSALVTRRWSTRSLSRSIARRTVAVKAQRALLPGTRNQRGICRPPRRRWRVGYGRTHHRDALRGAVVLQGDGLPQVRRLTHTDMWAGSRACCTTAARSSRTESRSTASLSPAANAATI
jgi:hypothetical protein